MEWYGWLVIAGFQVTFVVVAFRSGTKWGRIEGYATALQDAKDLELVAEQRQRAEYTDYLRQQEERDQRRRDWATDDSSEGNG